VEPIQTDGKVGHAEITVNGARIAMSDEFQLAGVAPPQADRGNAVTLMLEAKDVAGTLDRVRNAGATVDREADRTPYGIVGVFHDPFGHRWMLHTRTT
jgi:PhnB protein